MPLICGINNLNSPAPLPCDSGAMPEVADYLQFKVSALHLNQNRSICGPNWSNAVLQMCLWCGDGYRDRECQEKSENASKPKCWNCEAQNLSSTESVAKPNKSSNGRSSFTGLTMGELRNQAPTKAPLVETWSPS